jgi:hypothetical protein
LVLGEGTARSRYRDPEVHAQPPQARQHFQTLRDTLDSGSKNDVPGPLKSCAVYYFGSLEKALAATNRKGVSVSTKTKTKIKTVLCRMHTAKQSLIYGQARRNDPALVRAAEKQFGSWGKALYAAGIDPNLYYVRHKALRVPLRLVGMTLPLKMSESNLLFGSRRE